MTCAKIEDQKVYLKTYCNESWNILRSDINWIRVYVGYIVTVDIGRDLKVDLLQKIPLDTRYIETFKTCLTYEN